MGDNRAALLAVLNAMPEEAFGYVLMALKQVIEQNEFNHGFRPESTRSFVELAKAVNEVAGMDLLDMGLIRQHNPRLFEDESPTAALNDASTAH